MLDKYLNEQMSISNMYHEEKINKNDVIETDSLGHGIIR